MNYIKPTLYIVIAITICYLLDIRIVVDFIDSYKAAHNYFVDYILTFRYKQPLVFISLPFIAVWLIWRR